MFFQYSSQNHAHIIISGTFNETDVRNIPNSGTTEFLMDMRSIVPDLPDQREE